MKTISLTGFMGCGKSSVGRELSSIAGADFIDLDEYIETAAGKSINEIFAEGGEAGFRKIEKECLDSVLSAAENGSGLLVLSLGGGTLTDKECAAKIKEKTFCVYLRARIDTLTDNLVADMDRRPMLAGAQKTEDSDKTGALRKRISDLMSVRSSVYDETAHLVIDIDGMDFRQTAGRIMSGYCR